MKKKHVKHHASKHKHKQMLIQAYQLYLPEKSMEQVASILDQQEQTHGTPMIPYVKPKQTETPAGKELYDRYALHEDAYLKQYHATLQQYRVQPSIPNAQPKQKAEDTPIPQDIPQQTQQASPAKVVQTPQQNTAITHEDFVAPSAMDENTMKHIKAMERAERKKQMEKPISFVEQNADGRYTVWYTDGTSLTHLGVHEALDRDLKPWEREQNRKSVVTKYWKRDDGSYFIQYQNGNVYDSGLADQIYNSYVQAELKGVLDLAANLEEQHVAAADIAEATKAPLDKYMVDSSVTGDEKSQKEYEMFMKIQTDAQENAKIQTDAQEKAKIQRKFNKGQRHFSNIFK